MGLDFSSGGNGAEILYAGAFTLVAVLASVWIALGVQRRDFRKRESERQDAFEQRQRELEETFARQNEAEMASWRRHIAEKMISLIDRAASFAISRSQSDSPYTLREEAKGLHTILHLDGNDACGVGAWLEKTVGEIAERPHVHNQDQYNEVVRIAANARVKPMLWAYDPAAAMEDPEVQKADAALHDS